MDLLIMVISAILVKNIILAQYLGNCPFLGVSKKRSTALGMGMAVIFVLTLSSLVTWLIWTYCLVPLDLVHLRTIVFILIIATFVQLVEFFQKKSMPALYRALGIYLPLITTNCAVLGVAVLCVKNNYNFIEMLVFSLSSAVGYALALVLFSGLRERFTVSHIPAVFQDTAIGLVTAGLMALAFFGFRGMV